MIMMCWDDAIFTPLTISTGCSKDITVNQKIVTGK